MDTTLSDKTYMVTGTTSGIGLAAAEILVRRGASIIGVGRSPERGCEAERRLRAVNPSAQVTILTANLALQPDVRRLALQVGETLSAWNRPALDGLANVAGTFTYWMVLTPEGFETQWAVNHLAPFLLTNQILPLIQAAPRGRVVTVSSGSHYGNHINWDDPQLKRHYNGLSAYGCTKMANILFTLELSRRLGTNSTVQVFAADPGLVKTDIGLKGTPALVRRVWEWRRAGGISPEESARGIAFLLTDPGIQHSSEIYWLHGQPKRASRQALDTASAGRLWALSARMCAINTIGG
jgi:retinol dehydrogenase 12